MGEFWQEEQNQWLSDGTISDLSKNLSEACLSLFCLRSKSAKV
jgi:hypothetical protein